MTPPSDVKATVTAQSGVTLTGSLTTNFLPSATRMAGPALVPLRAPLAVARIVKTVGAKNTVGEDTSVDASAPIVIDEDTEIVVPAGKVLTIRATASGARRVTADLAVGHAHIGRGRISVIDCDNPAVRLQVHAIHNFRGPCGGCCKCHLHAQRPDCDPDK